MFSIADRIDAGFLFLQSQFLRINEAKIKEGIFVGSQISLRRLRGKLPKSHNLMVVNKP